MVKPRVVFLLGPPRSGTTLLQRMAGAHPSVYAYPEPHVLTPLYHMGFYRRAQKADFDVVNASEALREFVHTLPSGESAYVEALRAYANTLYTKALEGSNGKILFLDKTPAYTLYPSFVRTLYPDAPCVLITRHPWAVMHSVAHSFFNGDCALAFADMPVLEEYFPSCVVWKNTQGCVHVSYETLVQKPHDTLRCVMEHMGVQYQDAYVQYGDFDAVKGSYGDPYTIHQQTQPVPVYSDAWKHAFESDAVFRVSCENVLKKMGPDVFEQLGYPVETLRPGIMPVKSVRGYVLRRFSVYGFKRWVLLLLRKAVRVSFFKRCVLKLHYYTETVLREVEFKKR
jgi:hypothetical protein